MSQMHPGHLMPGFPALHGPPNMGLRMGSPHMDTMSPHSHLHVEMDQTHRPPLPHESTGQLPLPLPTGVWHKIYVANPKLVVTLGHSVNNNLIKE